MNQLIVNKFVQKAFYNSALFIRADHLNSFLLDISRIRGLLIYMEHSQNPIDQLLNYFNIQQNDIRPDNQIDNLMINMNENEKNTLKAVLNYFIFMYMDRAIYNFRQLNPNTFPPNLLIFDVTYYSIYYNSSLNCNVNDQSENVVECALNFLHQYILRMADGVLIPELRIQ
jgi:hypothetical protein